MTQIHLFISGRVQGVWYRQRTLEKATALGLDGWVRNLGDGRVEIQACGPQDDLLELLDWCWKGPTLARVRDIDVRWGEGSCEPGFRVA